MARKTVCHFLVAAAMLSFAGNAAWACGGIQLPAPQKPDFVLYVDLVTFNSSTMADIYEKIGSEASGNSISPDHFMPGNDHATFIMNALKTELGVLPPGYSIPVTHGVPKNFSAGLGDEEVVCTLLAYKFPLFDEPVLTYQLRKKGTLFAQAVLAMPSGEPVFKSLNDAKDGLQEVLKVELVKLESDAELPTSDIFHPSQDIVAFLVEEIGYSSPTIPYRIVDDRDLPFAVYPSSRFDLPAPEYP